MTANQKKRVGVIGGRGVVGQELMKLLAAHPDIEVVFGAAERIAPEAAAAQALDALLLCAPNGVAPSYVAALDAAGKDPVVVDLSSDHRFVDSGWVYGLPERTRARVRGARRIANPGCYATAAQLALDPFLDVLAGPPTIFGVSGYSGAGATPSPKNDPVRLADNLLPYDLVGHTQEREISRHLGRPVAFMPHVASFFVGITLTIALPLAGSTDSGALRARASTRYRDEPLVRVVDGIPEVRDARGTHVVTVGGFAAAADGSRAVVIATIDNLLKGAATQAVQNMNIALGLAELAGISSPTRAAGAA